MFFNQEDLLPYFALQCIKFFHYIEHLEIDHLIRSKSRKRTRNPDSHKKNINKQKVEKGLERSTKSKKIIPEKKFKSQVICCKKNCAAKVTIERQQEIFSTFYNLMDWTAKTMFIRNCIVKSTVESSSNPIIQLKKRQYNYEYSFLNDAGLKIAVCKRFLLTCIQVSSSRVNNAMNSIIHNPSAREQRGKKQSWNKTDANDKQIVIDFIDKFPRYRSHYGRSSSDKYYLSPNLNIMKMYREYKLVCEFRQTPVLSEHIFREVFNKEFNLSFKRPRIDTCKLCDEFNAKLTLNRLSCEQRQIETQNKSAHDEEVEKTKSQFLKDVEDAAKSEGTIQCLTFDLQKTLETPSLATSEFYYKRKLWTYNLCIFDEVEKKGYMYVWSENIASRGAQEVASCLKFHLENYLNENAEIIILYSDACGAQNRNIKVVLMLKKVLLTSPNKREIVQKFFTSGHSYNSCDRCFGLIEKQKRVTSAIFSVDHWIQLISRAKKTDPLFEIIEMKSEMFFSTKNLEKMIVNRKKNIFGGKINWHLIAEIRNNKLNEFSLHIRQKSHESEEVVDLKKTNIELRDFIDVELENLNSGYNPISVKKYNDLMCLLKYIPSLYHDFYRNLKVDKNNDDDDYNFATDSECDEIE